MNDKNHYEGAGSINPRSKLSRYEMNVVVSQQAAENYRSSRKAGFKSKFEE